VALIFMLFLRLFLFKQTMGQSSIPFVNQNPWQMRPLDNRILFS
jgi:hypothetical protein